MTLKSNWAAGDTFANSDANAVAAAVNAISLTPTTVKTSSFTASAGDLGVCDASSGAFTVTLPTGAASGTQICAKKIDSSANTVTVACGGSDVFNKSGGSTTLQLKLPNQALTVQYSSGIWYVVSDDQSLAQLDTRFAAHTAQARVFDARDYGVIADGNAHNNVANLLDCFSQCQEASVAMNGSTKYVYGAGGGTVLLPAGVINTSEAVYGTTLTADSGRTYFNNGAIPLFSDVTVMGHGQMRTRLNLSAGFTRAFDLWYDQFRTMDFKNITIKGMTVSREWLRGNTPAGTGLPIVCAPQTVSTAVTSTAWGYFNVAVPTPSAFANCDAVYVSSGSGSLVGHFITCRLAGGNLQLFNDSGSTITIHTDDVLQGTLQSHVLLGNNFRVRPDVVSYTGLNSHGDNWGVPGAWNIDNLVVEDVDVVAIAFDAPTDWGVNTPNTASGITIMAQPYGSGVTTAITNCKFERVRIFGGETGISIGTANNPWIDNISMIDCYHDTTWAPSLTYKGAGGNFMAFALGVGTIHMERCVGKNSFDVAVEVDNAWHFTCVDCEFDEAWNGAFNYQFAPPARTSAGPAATTLSADITSGATTATITALPAGVARQGLAQIGSEMVWYRATNGTGTSVSLSRGVNGSTAAAHTSTTAFTFWEIEKTRYVYDRVRVNNRTTSALGAGIGAGFVSYNNGTYPLPPATFRDCVVNLSGGDLYTSSNTFGSFITWKGWRPATVIENCTFNHSAFANSTGAVGGGIGWSSDGTAANYTTGYIPPQRIIGRNNTIRTSGTTSNSASQYKAINAKSGHVFIDLDIAAEISIASMTVGNARIVDFNNGDTSHANVIAPGSRVGITPINTASMTVESQPVALSVGPTTTTTLVDRLDVTLTAADAAATGVVVDSGQSGKVWLSYMRPQFVNAKTASYTLVGADAASVVTLSSSSALNLTVPTYATVPFAVGTRIDLLQLGSGQVTVVAASGVTIVSTPGLKLSAQYAEASLLNVGLNSWVLFGSLGS